MLCEKVFELSVKLSDICSAYCYPLGVSGSICTSREQEEHRRLSADHRREKPLRKLSDYPSSAIFRFHQDCTVSILPQIQNENGGIGLDLET